MYGFRARLGFILAPGNTNFENEIHSLLPHGVSAHFTRMPSKAVPHDQIARSYAPWAKDVEEYVKQFQLADVKCIAVANTIGSLALGPNGDNALVNRMQQASGVRCTTALASLLDAMQKLKAKKVGVVFPYFSLDPELDKLLVDCFESAGISVKAKQNVSLDDARPLERQIPNLDPTVFYQLGMKIAKTSDSLDAIVSPAVNLPSVDVIDDLEQDSGKCVITGLQAIVWSSLRIAGITDKITRGGRLFTEN